MGIRTAISGPSNDFRIYNAVSDPGQGTDLAVGLPEVQEQMKEIALRARRPGTVGRPYDNANVPSVQASSKPGIEVASYEGIWTYLPEFRDLAPVSSSEVSGFDLSVRSRDENVGLLFSGMIEVPTSGSYTFFLESDSGANLFIHDAHLIDDDLNHTGAEKSGSINLEAGFHPFRLYYRHGTAGAHSLEVSWSGPGITKGVIPASVLVSLAPPAPEPVPGDDQASSNGGSVDIAVLANDADDGLPSALSIDAVGSPVNGTASIVGEQIRYTPNAGFYGTDQFNYTVTDGEFFVSARISVKVSFLGSDLWIPLDECNGQEVYEAGGSFLGSMSGFADPGAARVMGVSGKGLSFDGVDDQVVLPGIPNANLPEGDTPRTIMAWVKTGNASENSTIFSYGTNSNGQRFSFRTNANGGNPGNHRPRLEVQGGSIVGTTNINDGNWHHIAAVCDDFNGDDSTNVDETRLYVDGVLEVISGSASRVIDTSGNTTAILGGSGHATGYNFSGQIDDLRIYPEALTAVEIQAIVNQTNLAAVAWHRENFGPVAIDWLMDGDGDGYSRLAEYAFGLNPHLVEEKAPIQAYYDETSLRLKAGFFRRISGNHGLIYTPQFSRDLVDWTTLGSTETGSLPNDDPECFEWVSVESNEISTDEPTQFFRVAVELAP